MGKEIVYCGACGKSLREDDFAKGKAHVQDNQPFCVACRPTPAPPSPSSARLKAMPSETPRGFPRPATTRKTHAPEGGTGSRTPLLVGGGIAVAGFILLAIVMASGGNERPVPDAAGTPEKLEPAPKTAVANAPPASPPPRPAPILPAPRGGEDPAAVLKKLQDFAAGSSEPDQVLVRCDEARAALRGTAYEPALKEVEARAQAARKRRDQERQLDAALDNARKIIATPYAAEREEEVMSILRSARDVAGPRLAEVDTLMSDFQKILKQRAPAPPPPVPVAPPAPPPPSMPLGAGPPPAAPPSGTFAFQDGVYPTADYRGTLDTNILEGAPDKNDGRNNDVEGDGDAPSKTGMDTVILLRWDVSSIPAGSTVESATLRFHLKNGTKEPYLFYEVKRAWAEREATWKVWASGQGWEVPGGRGPQDRGTEPLGRLTGPTGGVAAVPLNAAGVALVQSWVNNSAANLGLMLLNYDTTDGVEIFSREHKQPAERPMLTVVLAPKKEPPKAAPTKVLFKSGAGTGFAKLEGGQVVTADGAKALSVPPKGLYCWGAFSTTVKPSTVLRLRLKPLADVRGTYLLAWSDKAKDNLRCYLKGLKKGEWNDVEVRAAEFRLGALADGASFEGHVFSNVKLVFEGAAEARILLEELEIKE